MLHHVARDATDHPRHLTGGHVGQVRLPGDDLGVRHHLVLVVVLGPGEVLGLELLELRPQSLGAGGEVVVRHGPVPMILAPVVVPVVELGHRIELALAHHCHWFSLPRCDENRSRLMVARRIIGLLVLVEYRSSELADRTRRGAFMRCACPP